MNINQNYFPNATKPATPIPQNTPENKIDSVFAWLSLILAFFFCHTVAVANHPMGGFLLVLAVFITAFTVLRLKKIKLHPCCILSSISALLLSAALILTESFFLLSLIYVYCLASCLFLIYTAFGNRVQDGYSDYIYVDFIKILFVLPFSSLAAIFPAIANNTSRRVWQLLLKILIGIGIAIIPTTLVFAFLSYDDGFMKLLDDIFSFDWENVPQLLYSFIFTLPYAMYGFGLYSSAQKGVMKEKFTVESCKNTFLKMRILPQLTAVVAAAPIIFLYVVFFVSQWKYYISGFTGILPENFSYAEYARQGFFELCAVSVINLLIITAFTALISRGRKQKGAILKLLTVVFCLFTLVLISTAVAKLVMYISYYGLTQKRIYAMWMMAVIAIIFLVIALGQFIPKFRIVAVSVTVLIAMFIPLALCNVNMLTANYNTDRYLAGTLETVDTELMEELGDSAIPSLVKLVSCIDAEEEPELLIAIDTILHNKKQEIRKEKFSLFAFNIPSALAKSALQDYEPDIPPAGMYYITYIYSDEKGYIYDDDDPKYYMNITADKTASATFKDKSYSMYIENGQLIYGEYVFDCIYEPATKNYPAELELELVSEDNIYCIIRLNGV